MILLQFTFKLFFNLTLTILKISILNHLIKNLNISILTILPKITQSLYHLNQINLPTPLHLIQRLPQLKLIPTNSLTNQSLPLRMSYLLYIKLLLNLTRTMLNIIFIRLHLQFYHL